MENSDNLYDCDVCCAPNSTKSIIRKHKRNDHFQCPNCEKYLKDTKSLDDYMIKSHKENIKKHQLERDPSLRNNKMKKTDLDVGQLLNYI